MIKPYFFHNLKKRLRIRTLFLKYRELQNLYDCDLGFSDEECNLEVGSDITGKFE